MQIENDFDVSVKWRERFNSIEFKLNYNKTRPSEIELTKGVSNKQRPMRKLLPIVKCDRVRCGADFGRRCNLLWIQSKRLLGHYFDNERWKRQRRTKKKEKGMCAHKTVEYLRNWECVCQAIFTFAGYALHTTVSSNTTINRSFPFKICSNLFLLRFLLLFGRSFGRSKSTRKEIQFLNRQTTKFGEVWIEENKGKNIDFFRWIFLCKILEKSTIKLKLFRLRHSFVKLKTGKSISVSKLFELGKTTTENAKFFFIYSFLLFLTKRVKRGTKDVVRYRKNLRTIFTVMGDAR